MGGPRPLRNNASAARILPGTGRGTAMRTVVVEGPTVEPVASP